MRRLRSPLAHNATPEEISSAGNGRMPGAQSPLDETVIEASREVGAACVADSPLAGAVLEAAAGARRPRPLVASGMGG